MSVPLLLKEFSQLLLHNHPNTYNIIHPLLQVEAGIIHEVSHCKIWGPVCGGIKASSVDKQNAFPVKSSLQGGGGGAIFERGWGDDDTDDRTYSVEKTPSNPAGVRRGILRGETEEKGVNVQGFLPSLTLVRLTVCANIWSKCISRQTQIWLLKLALKIMGSLKFCNRQTNSRNVKKKKKKWPGVD